MTVRLVAAIAATVLALSAAAHAAAPSPAAPGTYRSGPGSLSGIWIGAGIRNEAEAGDTRGQGTRTAGTGAPQRDPPLKPQYIAEWRKRQQDAREKEARGEAPFADWVACLPTGMPGMMSAIFPMEIIETPTHLLMNAELFNQTRRIYLDRPQTPVDDTMPGFFGRSVGHWEGETLVVDTIAIKPEVRIRDMPHSPNMRLTERIRTTGPDTLEDVITITDPEYLTEPVVQTVRLRREANYEMQEYYCENNRVYADPVTGKQKLRVEASSETGR